MKKKFYIIICTAAIFFSISGMASALTMTFENPSNYRFSTYTEDGMLLTNNIGNGLWDASISGGSGNKALHLDDGMVTLSMVDNGLFNLQSIDIDYNRAPIDFIFDNGSKWTYANTGRASVIDFSALSFASSIQWVQIDGNSPWCTQLDSITVDTAPVPEPASIFLIGTGLVGLAGARKKRLLKK